MLSGWFENASEWLRLAVIFAGAAMVGFILAWLTFKAIRWYGKKHDYLLLRSVNSNLRTPMLWLAPILFALAAPSSLGIPAEKVATVNLLLEIAMYIAGGALFVQLSDVVSDLMLDRYRIDLQDNLEERKILTQFHYLKRVVTAVAVVVVIAFVLLQFDRVRELGAGLLASAGVAGIIIGLAAQKSIANLLAGFQLAFTQPIRIDDVVIVEGEWGKIEEITLTYVVIRIWDERRLVVPLNYFNENPFQNWTRSSSQLLGYVFLYTDYRLPVDALRKHYFDIVEQHEKWDGRVRNIQVTNSDRHTMELRILMSARNAPDAWDLRCAVREQLITFIQENYPECLPRTRVELPNGPLGDSLNG
ncbi:MAG: mechanosensitive ion channel [Phaeodactylibacter sp.]|nr:mechanosensitive ion channel [Phaeodactylibacter sp.]MCB9048400.1 mechanosensitive ion channel [Lewinellaceae bacterium]